MSVLNDLTLGQYLPTDSPVHRLDPRTKLCGAMAIMIALMLVDELRIYPVVFLWLLGVTHMAQLPFSTVMKNIRAFRWLLVITFAAHAFFTPGQAFILAGASLPGVTEEGAAQGLLFTGRLIAIMLTAAALTLSTAPIEVADGLESLLGPFKRMGVPAHELAMMMVIALRFIPTLVEEADRLQKAQTARGADFTGNPIRRAKKLMALLIPLMLSAFRRADELAVAMESRCYRGGEGRTRFRELCFTRNDYLAVALILGLIGFIWILM